MRKKLYDMPPFEREKLRLIKLVLEEAKKVTGLGGGKVKFTCKDGRM